MSWLKPRPTKNFKGNVKTRTLHTPKGFGTPAGFSCALGEARCRADQSATRHERTVSNDNVVQWDGRRFQIPQQSHRFSFAGAKVQIYQALNGRVSLYYGDTRLEHSAFPGGVTLSCCR
jgi:hypothetical protein